MKPLDHPRLTFLATRSILAVCIILLSAQNLWALGKKTYKVGIPTDKAPFVFTSLTKKGIKLRGAYIDVMTQIAHHQGVVFKYIKCDSPTMMIQFFKDKKIDIIGMTLSDFPFPIDGLTSLPVGLNMSSWIFVHRSCKTIVCQKDLSDKQVAVIGFKGLGTWPYDHSNVSEIFQVQTPQSALKLLNQGHVNAFIAPSEEIASYIIQKQGMTNVRRVGLALKKIPLGLSFNTADTQLSKSLARAIQRTKTSGVLHQIKEKWYGVEYKHSLVKKYSRLVFSTIGFVLLVLGFVLTWNRQLKKKVGKITIRFKTSEKRYRNLIESSPDMMFVVDREARIYTMNREARSLIPKGFDAQNDLPDLMEIIFPADREKASSLIEEVFTKKRSVNEFRFKNQKSGYREIDVAANLLPAEPGEKPKACLFARDVTERNRIERDLVQADRMAIIGQMAADVAHEINNPIGIVRANIDVILARGWFTPEAKDFLESCKRNTVRAGVFTRDLLAMAKPKVPEMKNLNLWELINTTIGIMGAQLKNIVVKKQSRGEAALILGDQNLLQQVLVNLLLNAAVAVQKKTNPEISITCCVPKGSDMVRLRVEDKGVGIPKQHLNEVFEPFFTQGKKEGFGLGLFISKRIIENHNGIIYAESEVNVGTQFIIEIPLDINPVRPDQRKT